MRQNRRRLLLVLLALGGCAANSAIRATQPTIRPARPAATPSTQPAARSNSGLTLDEIDAQPRLPVADRNAPALEPPLEAVRLFAKARIAQLDGQRADAEKLLEQAISLDADSFELHKSLGDLYGAASDARAGAEWEKAAAIDPDHLDLQIDLGRRALDEGNPTVGLEHLRLGLLTTDYRRDDPADGEADFLLARALEQQGYDRAALQMYERLLARIRGAHFAARMNPQMGALLSRPDALALHVAGLYEKTKSFAPALSLLRSLGEGAPENFEVQSRIVRDEAAAGEADQAAHDAAGLLVRFHAQARSVALLSEVAGIGAAHLLQKLHESNPLDRDLTCALADVLAVRGRAAEAGKVLAEAMARWPDDPRLLRRQVDLLRSENHLLDAARLTIAAFARRPDHQIELAPIWDSLAHVSPFGRLRVGQAQSMTLPADAQPALLVLMARLAETEHRDGVERDALTRAVKAQPTFAPAYRESLALIWANEGRSKQQKIDDSRDLAARAGKAGDAALAAELRGQALLDLGEAQPAASEFAAAVKAGDRAPELYQNFAVALHGTGDDRGAEALLWRVISDHPLAADAYEALYAIYQKRQEPERAKGALSVWLSVDPDSISAGQLQARQAFAIRQFTDAEHVLLQLLADHDNDPRVLASVEQFYSETGRLGELAPILQRRLASEPWNASLAMTLGEVYWADGHHPEALGVLESVRKEASRDVAQLYALAGAYGRIGAEQQNEQVLRDVIKLDPSFAGANNDLGYTWAEQGENLDQAEAMVGKALRDEPDNPSFLDSMGWVLYKRGKFEQAAKNLERAAALADPVVLDHLGDALYRLGNHDQAARQWKQAAAKIGDPRDDERDELTRLRKRLLKKQQEVAAGQPASVAPVAEEK